MIKTPSTHAWEQKMGNLKKLIEEDKPKEIERQYDLIIAIQ
jgi:hypothetical protein